MKSFLRAFVFLFLCLCYHGVTLAQYAPAVDSVGTTAIHKDSSVFVAWATSCSVIRGLKYIAQPDSGYASAGDSSAAIGMAGTAGIVSLGDGGAAILQFDFPIVNGDSWDFAVFENSFDNFFLELAFVEVSSDGINYTRFPSHSLTDTLQQVGTFDSLDASKLNNLAGKYRAMYGTPFDLEELKNIPGLDVNHITHVRIIDVVGSLQEGYASYDTAGRRINDPWPTPFPSSGFDLDAVGVIWNTVNALPETLLKTGFLIYPNPAKDMLNIRLIGSSDDSFQYSIFSFDGRLMKNGMEHCSSGEWSLNVSDLLSGLYFLKIDRDEVSYCQKFVITH